MTHMITLSFPNAETAFALRGQLAKLQQEYLIEMEDLVVVTRDEKGKVKLHQAASLTAAGAVSGSFWGLLIGAMFLNPLAGMLVGAGAGAVSGKLSDIGIGDEYLRDLGKALPKGGSALFILVRNATPDKVLERLEPFRGEGTLLHTTLNNASEADLRALLSES